MNDVQAVLLDIDGTVLDTREFIYQAAEYSLAQNGYPPIPREKIALATGMSFDEFYFFILNSREIDTLPLQTAHRTFQLEHIDLSTPYAGAVETVATLKERGYHIAAVTSRMKQSVISTLDSAGLTSFFNEIIAAEDAPELKPSPAPVFIALERMGFTPAEAVMVGDNDVDILAGKRAGTKTVRATYGFHFDSAHTSEETKADLYIDDITELLPVFTGPEVRN